MLRVYAVESEVTLVRVRTFVKSVDCGVVTEVTGGTIVWVMILVTVN